MNKQLAFFFDQKRCISCNVCSVSCKDYNQLNPGLVNWRKQYTYETEDGFYPLSMSCNHCEMPTCMEACPVGAIKKMTNGIVHVDRNTCQGIGDCTSACPFTALAFADDKQEPKEHQLWITEHPVQKCTMCIDRLEKGLKPVCVNSCIGRALDIDTKEKILLKHPDAIRLNIKEFPYAYTSDSVDSTLPSFYIRKRGPLRVHKSKIYMP